VRVLHVVPTYVPAWRHGGPVFAVHGLCKALAARGHDVTVFTTDVHGSGTLGPEVARAAPVEVEGVTAWYFPVTTPRRLYRSPALQQALRRALPDAAHHGARDMAGDTAASADAHFDIVHLHSVFLWPTAAAAAAARRARVPYLVSPRGMLVADLLRRRGRLRKRLWIALVERRNLERAAALHTTSQLEADEASRLGLHLPPVVVIPNGVDPDLWQPQAWPLAAGQPNPESPTARFPEPWPPADRQSNSAPPASQRAEAWQPGRLLADAALAAAPGAAFLAAPDRLAGAPALALAPTVRAALERHQLLLFLGRISWKKGLDRLVQALAQVPGATLVIAGNDEEGYRPRLESLAAGAGVAGRILFVGAVAGADKAALLHGADALVLPSYSENFGNVVLEAMAAGLPVAVTAEVGAAQLVAESGAGLVAAGDPPALAAALAGLLADAPLRQAMGQRGIAAARQFSWQTIAARMEQVYQEILMSRPKPRSGQASAPRKEVTAPATVQPAAAEPALGTPALLDAARRRGPQEPGGGPP
jgi:glycosyltransferase involved in cell wall biosynthesis